MSLFSEAFLKPPQLLPNKYLLRFTFLKHLLPPQHPKCFTCLLCLLPVPTNIGDYKLQLGDLYLAGSLLHHPQSWNSACHTTALNHYLLNE